MAGQARHVNGLSGEVSPMEFSRLTEGRHPLTDEQMVQHRAQMEYKIQMARRLNLSSIVPVTLLSLRQNPSR